MVVANCAIATCDRKQQANPSMSALVLEFAAAAAAAPLISGWTLRSKRVAPRRSPSTRLSAAIWYVCVCVWGGGGEERRARAIAASKREGEGGKGDSH